MAGRNQGPLSSDSKSPFRTKLVPLSLVTDIEMSSMKQLPGVLSQIRMFVVSATTLPVRVILSQVPPAAQSLGRLLSTDGSINCSAAPLGALSDQGRRFS